MQAIILAAGYATRLYPLTENMPKAMLQVGGTTILDYLVDKIRTIDEIKQITLITNARFKEQFDDWANSRGDQDIAVLSDGTDENGTRLGAIGDMKFVVDAMGIDEDCMVVAADNYLRIDFQAYYKQYVDSGRNTLLLAEETDNMEMLRSFAVAKVDENQKIIKLVEKPAQPDGNLAVYALYLYPRACMATLNEYAASGKSMDAPGHYAQWLCETGHPVYIYTADGPCYDVGTHESLALVRSLYGQ